MCCACAVVVGWIGCDRTEGVRTPHILVLCMPITASLNALWYEPPLRPRPAAVVHVAITNLKLQVDPSLTSEVKGWLPLGALVIVLERKTLRNGTRRAFVLGEPRALTPGWISLYAEDGSENLGYFAPWFLWLCLFCFWAIAVQSRKTHSKTIKASKNYLNHT